MRNRLTRRLVPFLAMVVCLAPLSAASLADILADAAEASTQVNGYVLAKQNAELSASLSDTEDQTVVTVTSGDVSAAYYPEDGEYRFGTSGTSVSATFPDDWDTTVSVGTGAVSYLPSTGYKVNPYLSAGRTITIGDTGDDRSSLLATQTSMLGSYNYESNMIGFRSAVYQQIRSMLSAEKSIRETERQIEDAKTEMENALKLGTMDETSITYKQKANTLLSLENTLESLKANAELLAAQYEQLTGLEWDGVSDVPEPDLTFTTNPNGNTSVALKALALKIAQENLDVQQAALENKTVKVSGKLAFPVATLDSQYSSSSLSNSIDGTLSGSYSAKNYSFGAAVDASYSIQDGTLSPSLTVSGSWSSDSTALADKLTLQKLQNEVMIAQNDYNSALSDYLTQASQLSADIAAWKLSHSLLENTVAYHAQVLEQQKTLFEKGLARQSDVDDAAFAVAQDRYDQTIDLLDGLVLQNRIETLQL